MGRIHVPTRDTFPATADAVVIGGGIVGVATAFWLSHAGLRTVVLEMREGLATLSTANSVECVRAQFSEPIIAELALLSLDVYENFGDVIGDPTYDISLHQQGYLFVTDEPARIDELKTAVATHHVLGVTDSEFLDHDALRARFPYLAESVVAGSFRQRDGWLSAHEATQGFAKGSQADFLVSTRATGIQRDGRGVSRVETPHGTIATRLVVDAAGPFAGIVGRMVGVDLPLEPVRRQKAFIEPRPQIPPDAPLTIDLAEDAYWRPETGGAYIAWVDPDEPPSEPAEEMPTDWDFAAIVLDKLSRLTPFWGEIAGTLTQGDVHPGAGQYVYTPDEQPLIGPVPEVPGFYVNCGYWAGVMLSPAAGRRIADLVTGVMDPQDNLLRPTRYAEGLPITARSFLRGRY